MHRSTRAWYVARGRWVGSASEGKWELRVQCGGRQRALSGGRVWVAGDARPPLVRAVDGGASTDRAFPLSNRLGFGRGLVGAGLPHLRGQFR